MQKQLNSNSIKDSVAYIFILPKVTTQDGSSIAVLGDMPRNHQVIMRKEEIF